LISTEIDELLRAYIEPQDNANGIFSFFLIPIYESNLNHSRRFSTYLGKYRHGWALVERDVFRNEGNKLDHDMKATVKALLATLTGMNYNPNPDIVEKASMR